MHHATESTSHARRMHIELRTGDVLSLPGCEIRLVFKRGQVARMEVCAPPDTPVKKIPAASRPVPSLPT